MGFDRSNIFFERYKALVFKDLLDKGFDYIKVSFNEIFGDVE